MYIDIYKHFINKFDDNDLFIKITNDFIVRIDDIEIMKGYFSIPEDKKFNPIIYIEFAETKYHNLDRNGYIEKSIEKLVGYITTLTNNKYVEIYLNAMLQSLWYWKKNHFFHLSYDKKTQKATFKTSYTFKDLALFFDEIEDADNKKAFRFGRIDEVIRLGCISFDDVFITNSKSRLPNRNIFNYNHISIYRLGIGENGK